MPLRTKGTAGNAWSCLCAALWVANLKGILFLFTTVVDTDVEGVDLAESDDVGADDNEVAPDDEVRTDEACTCVRFTAVEGPDMSSVAFSLLLVSASTASSTSWSLVFALVVAAPFSFSSKGLTSSSSSSSLRYELILRRRHA
jgi:hypothetical protein